VLLDKLKGLSAGAGHMLGVNVAASAPASIKVALKVRDKTAYGLNTDKMYQLVPP
jgi:hypothetical protein